MVDRGKSVAIVVVAVFQKVRRATFDRLPSRAPPAMRQHVRCHAGIYLGCPVEPFSGPVPASDDVGEVRVSGAGLAG